MDFEPIKSSNLQEAHYDGKDKMTLRFKKSGLYEYSGVTLELYQKFAATFQTDDSSGQFFGRNIRQLSYKKLD